VARWPKKAFDLGLELNRLIGRKVGLDLGRVFFGVVHKGLGGHVRHLISGGAALPKGTAEVFSGLGLHLSEGYGLTEASPVLTVAKATPGTKAGHVGKPIPGVEIKIANADDQGVGEILAKGPNVMVGYANNEEATRAAIDADGWLHTGDLGKLDKKGKLVIVGRQKDVIVSASGENVYPDDLESLLGKVAFVKELAIVGIDDPRGGERVACLAVPERDDEETAPESSGGPPSLFDIDSTRFRKKERHDRALKALREAFQRLPKGMVPAVLHVVDADLPRTATRKVKRPEVRDILQRIVVATAPAVAGDAGSEVSRVRHAIAALAGRKATELAGATQLKAELGFDSLLTMELGAALEPISGVLDTTALARCETVGDVESLVRTTGSRGASEAARTVEKVQEEVEIPAPIASALKSLLGKAQMGFYGDVMDPKVYGRAFIPHNRSALVAANHSSHLDMGFVKYALGDYGEGLVSLAAQDYFFEGNPLRRAYFKQLTNLAAFDRKGGLRQALRQAGEILEEGKTLLIFPEGTRSVDGRIQEFKPAIGHLALTHGVDILPVFLRGTHESWAKGKKLPTKRRLEAHIGPPLCIEDLRRLTAGMKITAASRRIAELTQEAVCALRDGKVLDLSRVETITPERVVEEHRLVSLFRELEAKFDPSRVSQPVTYYFTLGNDARREVDAAHRPRRLRSEARQTDHDAGRLRAQDLRGDLPQDLPRGVHTEPHGVHDGRGEVERHLPPPDLPESVPPRMSQYLVTGGTGFLGHHLVSALIARGHGVTALVREGGGPLEKAGASLSRGDVLDGASVERAAAGCDGAFHCAGKVSRKPEDAEALYRIHVDGTKDDPRRVPQGGREACGAGEHERRGGGVEGPPRAALGVRRRADGAHRELALLPLEAVRREGRARSKWAGFRGDFGEPVAAARARGHARLVHGRRGRLPRRQGAGDPPRAACRSWTCATRRRR
jgi:1-acyl-sn-glycerol-3-phosphate acyltransferase